jgi:hypothetical protein
MAREPQSYSPSQKAQFFDFSSFLIGAVLGGVIIGLLVIAATDITKDRREAKEARGTTIPSEIPIDNLQDWLIACAYTSGAKGQTIKETSENCKVLSPMQGEGK